MSASLSRRALGPARFTLHINKWLRERVPTPRGCYTTRFPGESVCQFRHPSALAEEVDHDTTQPENQLTGSFRNYSLTFRVTLPYNWRRAEVSIPIPRKYQLFSGQRLRPLRLTLHEKWSPVPEVAPASSGYKSDALLLS